jgi:murein biosynthesis integral membrane protein MurJ
MREFSRRIAGLHDNHKRIAAGAALIGLLTLVAKLFVAAREMAIAWRFGIGRTADAYQLALTITTWLPMMIGGVITVVLVPELVGLRTQTAVRQRFISELNGGVTILGLGTTALVWLAAPDLASLLASNTEPQTLELTRQMSRELAPLGICLIGATYLAARLQARERYWYSVSEALPAAGIATFVLLSGGNGTAVLVQSTLAGFLLQLGLLVLMVRQGDPPVGVMKIRQRSGQWAALYHSLLLMAFGQVLITASAPIDQGFAARIGEGAVATLAYANRVIALFSGLATIVIARALLPVFSASVSAGEFDLACRQAKQWSLLLFAAAAIGSAALWIASPEIVRLLFQRGAFTARASAEVGVALRAGLLQLPPYFAGMVFVQWYAANKRFNVLLMGGALALAVKVGANAIFTPRFGVEGIVAGSAIMYSANLALLAVLLRRRAK